MRPVLLLLPLALSLAACKGERSPIAAVVTGPDLAAPYVASDWVLPSRTGSAQPDLVATDDGRLLLAWINSTPGRRNALSFAALGADGRWSSEARTVVVGDALVANWADVPHVMAARDGALWVQWLQKAGGGSGYATDIALSRSVDGGFNWAAPVTVNADGVVAEHGFASLWPQGDDGMGVAWLAGAAEGHAEAGKSDDKDKDEHAAPAAGTALHTAVFDPRFARSAAAVPDTMTCDCCQTALAATDRGTLLLYRDRTAGEIRDIASVRFEDGQWTAPVPVHADGWEMPACPVNGPAVAADGNDVVAAWYTAAGDKPRVQLARSSDAGTTWAAPIVLDEGEAVQGRVNIALDDDQAWVLWVREDKDGQSLWLSRRTPDLAREYQRLQVAKLQGRGQATGFPQLALRKGSAHLVWTDVVDGAPQLRGAIVGPAPAG